VEIRQGLELVEPGGRVPALVLSSHFTPTAPLQPPPQAKNQEHDPFAADDPIRSFRRSCRRTSVGGMRHLSQA
jgi:hypothetical protein